MHAAIVPLVPGVKLDRLVVATDFSDASEPVVALATLLARRYGSQLTVVHVWSMPAFAATIPEAGAQAATVAQETAQAQLDTVLGCDAVKGLKVRGVLRFGDPVEHIRALVQLEPPDLLLLGTRGRSGISRAVLGSVAESVIRNVSCPVLTIGPNLHERFLNIKSLDIVLVATDLTAHSLSVIPFLVSITAEFRSNVQFLHVLPEKERSNVKLVAAAQSRMEKLCRPYFSARTLLGSGVEFGDPAKNILATAAVRDADLIAIGVRPGGRFVTHLHESVGFQIIAKATCPVLTVKHA